VDAGETLMPAIPQQPQLPATATPETPEGRWITSFVKSFQQLWFNLTYVLNTMCRVDTAANRSTTPLLNETFFYANDTERLFVGVDGAWEHVGRLNGVADGVMLFTEVADPAAPATDSARLYVRDNGAGKTQLVIRFPTGAIQTISTEP
jgi:hypothetical protein